VGLNFCKVTTLLDPSTELGAMISRSREICVAEEFRADEYGVLRLSFLKKEADIVVGDTWRRRFLAAYTPRGL
jgi:cell shape-determining protein MreC